MEPLGGAGEPETIAQAPPPALSGPGASLERLGHRKVDPALKQALKFDTATFPQSGPPKVRRQGSSRFVKSLSRGKSLKAIISTVCPRRDTRQCAASVHNERIHAA